LCREFVSNCPTRRTGHESELPLVIEPVDLVDDAVDVVAQAVATFTDLPVISETPVDAHDDLSFRANPETPQLQLIQYLAVALRQRSVLDQPYGIHIDIQWSRGSQARIELPQASCRSVSRIYERFLAFLSRLLIKPEEAFARHEHLPA